MNAPKRMLAKPVITTEGTDLSTEKPVLGTMNYARKFPEGQVGGYAAPGMPVQVGAATYLQKKKKESMPIASYRKGTKAIKTGPGSEVERATPSVEEQSTYPTATSPFSEVDNGDPDLTTSNLAAASDQPKVTAAPSQQLQELPADRNAGVRTPKDYKEAAAVIKGDKALYSQYKAGIASGKPFTLSVGGKSFKYAATPKGKEAPVSQEKLRDTFYGKDKPKRMSATKALPTNSETDADELPAVNLPVAPTLGKNISIQYGASPKRMKGKPK